MSNKDTTWVDTSHTEYPRMLNNEDARDLSMQVNNLFAYCVIECVHGRTLTARCIACEGLSILSGTRR